MRPARHPLTASAAGALLLPLLVTSFQPCPTVSTRQPCSRRAVSSTVGSTHRTPVVSVFQARSFRNPRPWSGVVKKPRTTVSRAALSVVDTTAVIDNFFQSQPYLSAFLTCSVKATAADVLAQVKESGGSGAASKTATSSASSQNDNDSSLSLNADTPGPRFDDGSNEAPAPGQHSASADLDWQRTSAFLFYGGLYQGLFQEFLYAGLFPKWFPSGDWQSVVAQVALDMTFFTVCLCLPVAYIFKTLFMAREKVTASGSAATPSWRTVQTALRKYKGDVQERGLLFKYWQIWIPAQSFNFVFVPTHYRVAFVAIVSFFWMFVLSVTSAQGDEEGCES